jgi:hypothetical protein
MLFSTRIVNPLPREEAAERSEDVDHGDNRVMDAVAVDAPPGAMQPVISW